MVSRHRWRCKILLIENDDFFLLFIPINCWLVDNSFLINTCNIISIFRRLIYLSQRLSFCWCNPQQSQPALMVTMIGPKWFKAGKVRDLLWLFISSVRWLLSLGVGWNDLRLCKKSFIKMIIEILHLVQ